MFPIITVVCCLASLTLFAIAAWTDRCRRIIANRISLALCGLFLIWGLAGEILGGSIDVAWKSHLIAGGATFAFAFALWYAGLFGGGDVKLLTAVALWAGIERIAPTILLITLAGAALAIIIIFVSRFWPHTAETLFGKADFSATEPDPVGDTPLENQENLSPAATSSPTTLPYGIAIAFGGVWVMAQIFSQYGIS